MTQREPPNEPASPRQKSLGFGDDRTEQTDVSQIHLRIVSREKREPEEGLEPPPWWLWGFIVVLLFAMGVYVGRFGGSFSAAVHEVEEPQGSIATQTTHAADGAAVFSAICQPCHQSHGLGIPGQYPPLSGSEWGLRDKQTPTRIVLFGLRGVIHAAGVTVDNTMPPLGDRLTNEEIAAALTYVRSSWKNSASPVLPADVQAVRAATSARDAWTPAELESLRNKGGHP